MIRKDHNYRFERKYLLDKDSAYFLNQRISYVLLPDNSTQDGHYHISSLYFDDQYVSAFREKHDGILTRDKFRARFYNGSMEKIRLERKHKHSEMVYKESAFITAEQYNMMCHGDYTFMQQLPDAVFEKFYTAHLLKRMRPSAMVEYDRQAYMHQTGNVRITFDSNLTASSPMSDRHISILPDESIVLEVKYSHFIPSFISDLLTGIPFTQLSISKFLMAELTLKGLYKISC